MADEQKPDSDSTDETPENTPDASASSDTDASASTPDPKPDAPTSDGGGGGSDDEESIRQELGIGGGSEELDQAQIEALLSEASGGYEDLFEGTPLSGAHPPGAPPPPPAASGSPAQASSGQLVIDRNLQLLRDVNMKVKVELGRGKMYLKDILMLGQGSVVELERLAGDPLDIYVNDKVIARGEVLVLNENFCIRITEIFDQTDLLKEVT